MANFSHPLGSFMGEKGGCLASGKDQRSFSRLPSPAPYGSGAISHHSLSASVASCVQLRQFGSGAGPGADAYRSVSRRVGDETGASSLLSPPASLSFPTSMDRNSLYPPSDLSCRDSEASPQEQDIVANFCCSLGSVSLEADGRLVRNLSRGVLDVAVIVRALAPGCFSSTRSAVDVTAVVRALATGCFSSFYTSAASTRWSRAKRWCARAPIPLVSASSCLWCAWPHCRAVQAECLLSHDSLPYVHVRYRTCCCPAVAALCLTSASPHGSVSPLSIPVWAPACTPLAVEQ